MLMQRHVKEKRERIEVSATELLVKNERDGCEGRCVESMTTCNLQCRQTMLHPTRVEQRGQGKPSTG